LKSISYKDLEIAIIGSNDGPWYTYATFENSRAVGKFNLNKDKKIFANIIKMLDDDSINGNELRNLGARIHKSLFGREIATLFSTAQRDLPPDIGLRININIRPPILNRLPWEFLYDKQFLAIQFKTPVIRKIPVIIRKIKKKKVSKKLRVLVVVSNPKDQKQLNVQREIDYIRSQLAELGKEYLEIELLKNAKKDELENSLRTQFDVFHFIGHAEFDQSSKKGFIVLEDENHTSKNYDSEVLSAILNEGGVRIAILNACDTARSAENGYMLGVAHSLLNGGIPVVVAMQFKIPDMTSILFTKRFYAEMARGEQITTALTRARQTIAGDTSLVRKDWGIPVLYALDPENLIFHTHRPLPVKTPLLIRRPSSRATRVIGICDINSFLINLESVTEKMNSVQNYFKLVVIPAFYSAEMFTTRDDRTFCDFEKAELQLKELFDKYKQAGLKRIMGATQNLITSEGTSNLFAVTGRKGISLISTFNLEDYALKANKTLEKTVMYLILGDLAVAYGNLSYHNETRSCLMDYCYHRDDIIKGLENPRLDESCQSKIRDNGLLSVLNKLLKIL